jgi:hypothetical protein
MGAIPDGEGEELLIAVHQHQPLEVQHFHRCENVCERERERDRVCVSVCVRERKRGRKRECV